MSVEQATQVGFVGAFVGLGSMGMGMAKSLLRAGLRVCAYDIRPQAVEAFVEAGGTGAASVAEAANIFVIVVLNAQQV